MRRIIKLTLAIVLGVCSADAAVRDTNTIQRGDTNTNQRTVSNTRNEGTAARTTTQRKVQRTAKPVTHNRQNTLSTRSATPNITARIASTNRTRSPQNNTSNRSTQGTKNTKHNARATITLNATQSNTFGTGYNTCRDAYFTCMDQFCGTANDTYRRCICSSKLSTIQERERTLTQTSNSLQDFQNLNLEVINKSAAEVQAMISASTGELVQHTTKDTSSAALQLAGISDVLSKSKSKSLSTQGTLDIAGNINAIWATTDLTGGANIANLTGEALYNAVHAQCTNIIADKCADTTTLNMVTSAYGMYIENDCSIILNGLDKKLINANGTIRAAEREMNLARLENYNAHNSSSIHDCMTLIRKDLTANTACGTDYVHCLDITGQYLSYDTGEPIYSPDFYHLETQLSLSGNILTNQSNRLLIAKLNSMRSFAQKSLDTCQDLADNVWDEFLRQAITEIYQGQHERIRQVKNECLDVVNKCYDKQTQSLKDFSNIDEHLLLGGRLELAEQMCQEKLNTCSNLYGSGPQGMQALLTTMHDTIDLQIGLQCHEILTNFTKNLCAVPESDTLHSYPFSCRVYAPGSQQYATIAACNANTTPTVSYPNSPTNTNQEQKEEIADYAEGASRPKEEIDTPYQCSKKYISCPPGSYMAGPSGTEYNGTPTVGNTCIAGQNTDDCNYPGGTNAPVCAYTKCATGYYMTHNGTYTKDPTIGNMCEPCPSGHTCAGGTYTPCPFGQKIDEETGECISDNENTNIGSTDQCGTDYVGSLYHKLVRYALDTCVRPSQSSGTLPTNILQDVNIVMNQLQKDMATALATECERMGGTWVSKVWIDNSKDDPCCSATQCFPVDELSPKTTNGCHDITGDHIHQDFYTETAANTQWGYCADHIAL